MTRLMLVTAIAGLGLAGCATPGGGVRGEVAFRATAHLSTFHSPRAPGVLADCFVARARLLPFGLVTADPIDGTPLYRLRYQDVWFEKIAFRAAPDGGTTIEVMTSGRYDQRWTSMLVRDRLRPLGECLARDEVASR